MGNGANRLFDVIHNTSESTNIKPSQIISLTVKSIQPLIFIRDDKLEIPKEFCVFSKLIKEEDIQIGDIVTAMVFNEGQNYFIEHNNNDDLVIMNRNEFNTLINDIYYKSGDNLQHSNRQTFPGMITGDAHEILFTVCTRKSLKNITSITINDLILSIRIPAGGYVESLRTDFSSYAGISNKFDYGFSISLYNDSGWGITNNTPIAVSAENLKVTFN